MRRRTVLAGAAGLAATAGCLSLPDTDDSHPFAGETVTVRVDENTDSPHNLRAITREALAFWEAHSERYAGFAVAFEFVDSGEPELILRYADDPQGCADVEGYSERVLGCAPIVEPDTSVPEPAVARVIAGPRPVGQVRTTTEHEVGHVLGLDHDDEPSEVMSNRPEDRLPLYDHRVEVQEKAITGAEQTSAARAVYADAVDLWNDGDYEAAITVFEQAREAYADAIERFETARDAAEEFEREPAVETVDLERVRTLLSALEQRVGLLASGASTMSEAAEAAARDDRETANARREEASDSIEAFREDGPLRTNDIALALGLVRGTDREEPVVGPDGG